MSQYDVKVAEWLKVLSTYKSEKMSLCFHQKLMLIGTAILSTGTLIKSSNSQLSCTTCTPRWGHLTCWRCCRCSPRRCWPPWPTPWSGRSGRWAACRLGTAACGCLCLGLEAAARKTVRSRGGRLQNENLDGQQRKDWEAQQTILQGNFPLIQHCVTIDMSD